MGTKHFGGLLRAPLRRVFLQLKEVAARRRRGIVLLAVLVFVALLLPLMALVLTSINTEAVSTAEAIKGAQSKEFRERMEPLGFEVVTGTPERMADMLRADAARWAPVVKAAGVKIE